jgi:hypothetical protein
MRSRDLLRRGRHPHHEAVVAVEEVTPMVSVASLQKDARLTAVVEHHPQAALLPLRKGEGDASQGFRGRGRDLPR